MRPFVQFGICLLACLHAARGANVVFGHEDESKNFLKDKNWDFEEDITSNDWIVRSASTERISMNCHTGQSCLRVYNRKSSDSGVSIRLYDLTPSTSYYFSIFIKQATNRSDGMPYSTLRILGRCYWESGKVTTFFLGRLTYMRADDMWRQLGSDFYAKEGIKYYEIWFRGEPKDIEYVLDSAAVTEIPAYRDFVKQTDAQINLNRKTNITIIGTVPEGSVVTVKLNNHEFGFGTAINGKQFIGSKSAQKEYRDFILNTFNWAVFENDMKWKPMEKFKGAVRFGVADQGLKYLHAKNIKVRGHAISWDLMDSNPKWVTSKQGSDLRNELFRRLNYVVQHYKGNITEWDVCNEYLHTHFFESRTGILDIIEDEFRAVHKIDPMTKLFLNDYQIVRDGEMTSAQANLARFLLSRGAPVHGVGIQSHLRVLPMKPEILAKRIQIAGSAGLPITITELSAHSKNIDIRAQGIEQALRVYFADPNVHAIILWGFGDQFSGFANDFFLFNGPHNTPNKAGEAMMKLFKKWKTSRRIVAPEGSVKTSFRGFYGNYTVTVMQGKKVQSTKTFKVSRDSDNIFQL